MDIGDEGEYLASWINLSLFVYTVASSLPLRRLVMVNFWDLYIFIFDNFVLGTSTFGEGFYLYIVFGLLSFMSFLIASALLVILSVYS